MGKSKIQRLWNENPNCFYCGLKTNLNYGKTNWLHATIDHVIPLSKGGGDTRENRVLACKGCNFAKSNMGADEFRKRLKEGTVPMRAIS